MVWSITAPEVPVATIELPTLSNAVALTQDGSRLYVGAAQAGVGQSVTVYDVASGAPAGSIRGVGGPLGLSPDGSTMAAVADNEVVLVDTVTGTVTARLRDHTERVNAVRFSHDGRLLASASDDRTVDVWDVASGNRFERLRGHTGPVWGLGFSPDDETLYTTGVDRAILKWDLVGDRRFLRRIGVDRPVTVGNGFVVPSPTGEAVAYAWIEFGPDGVLDAMLQFVDVDTGTARPPVDTGHLAISAVAWSPDGRMLATSGVDHMVRVWDWPGGRVRDEQRVGRGTIYGLDFSADGDRLLVGESTGVLGWLDAETLEPTQPTVQIDTGLTVLVAGPDDRRALAFTGELPGNLALYETVTALEESRQYSIIDTVDGGVVRQGDLPYSAEQVDVSADGEQIAVGGRGGQVAILDAETGALLGSPADGHDHLVLDVDFAPDGDALVSAGFDGRIGLWDGSTGARLGTVQPEATVPATAAFLPDGHSVLISGWNGSISRWDTDVDSWVAFACSVAGRDLTESEWEDAFGGRAYEPTCSG
jgi:WD40 repeat protein